MSCVSISAKQLLDSFLFLYPILKADQKMLLITAKCNLLYFCIELLSPAMQDVSALINQIL